MSHKFFHFVKFFDFYFKFWIRNDRLPNAIYRFVLKLELESERWDEKSYDKQKRLGMVKSSLEVQGEIGWQSHFSGIRVVCTHLVAQFGPKNNMRYFKAETFFTFVCLYCFTFKASFVNGICLINWPKSMSNFKHENIE
jgi:hypothetical protein